MELPDLITLYTGAWAEPDRERRQQLLERVCASLIPPGVWLRLFAPTPLWSAPIVCRHAESWWRPWRWPKGA